MNPFSYLKSLFTRKGSKVQPVDPWPKPEPSCFARGVAKLWEQGEGWKVSYDRKTGRVTLRHALLDTTITLVESLNQEKPIREIVVCAQGYDKISNGYSSGSSYYHPSPEDYFVVRDAILARPYVGLKTRMEKKAKQEAACAAKRKAIEELGCPTPVNESGFEIRLSPNWKSS